MCTIYNNNNNNKCVPYSTKYKVYEDIKYKNGDKVYYCQWIEDWILT